MSDIAWTILKTVYNRLMLRLQKHTKIVRYATAYRGILKRILIYLYCTK